MEDTMRAFTILMAAALVAAAPRPAAADWLFSPYVGGVFGGAARFGNIDQLEDEIERRITFGASLAWMGAGVAGFELDLGVTPNFFQNTVGPRNFAFGDSNVTTLMGNLIIGAPIGGQSGPGIRPYAVGGVGVLRTFVDGGALFNDLKANDLGVNIGGGLGGFFNDHFGLKGDLRYFRSLQDREPDDDLDLGLGSFTFWRGTVGATFRW
jgi:Outer membrane protein beta-barrel domain